MNRVGVLERRWDAMPIQQIVLSVMGLILGLILAALITQLILSMGASLITVSFSAICYLLLGYAGLRVGYRRYAKGKRLTRRRRHKHSGEADGLLEEAELALADVEDAEEGILPEEHAGSLKYLDSSVLIDGRVVSIAKAGFLEGRLVVPRFVIDEMQHLADSADPQRRIRGRRGLDMLTRLQETVPVTVDDTDYPDSGEVDVKLLRLCRDKGGAVLTNDFNLNKVAGMTGVRVLNINELANALKSMLAAGDELAVVISKEGKEPGQGVAYLEDGTMVVTENARALLGQTVFVIVTSVLQTSAGRMVFARLKEKEETV
jgi:Integral membrane protein (PIN domain superfamily)